MKFMALPRNTISWILFWIGLIIMPSTTNAQLIVAHRGASHDAPENTLAAFNLAWEQGADGIEADFWLSSDGHIVCIHDDTTERTCETNLDVCKSTLLELKKLDVGKWKEPRFAGERIPTLLEVIATVPDGKRIVIELKQGPEIVAPLKRILEKSELDDQQVLVISFDENTIAESKRLMPDIKTHWLVGYSPKDDIGPWTPTATGICDTIKQIGADGFGSQARRSVVNDQFKRQLQNQGVDEFHVWTVDDPADARFFQKLGVYCITTNCPAVIRRELEKTSR